MEREESPRINTYAEFWRFYLREHAHGATRAIHISGTLAAVALGAASIAIGPWWLALIAVAAGYAPAWFAHFFVEHNHPATFTYPLWSLASDFRMTAIWLTGGLARELAKANIAPEA